MMSRSTSADRCLTETPDRPQATAPLVGVPKGGYLALATHIVETLLGEERQNVTAGIERLWLALSKSDNVGQAEAKKIIEILDTAEVEDTLQKCFSPGTLSIFTQVILAARQKAGTPSSQAL